MPVLGIYALIYEDGKIKCGKWRATITATLDTATIPGSIHPQSSSKGGLPLKTFNFLGPRIS